MKQILFIIIIQFCSPVVKAGTLNDMQLHQVRADTSIVKDSIEQEIIAEVIKTKAPPEKEKVQYFSQVTKYGFKKPVCPI